MERYKVYRWLYEARGIYRDIYMLLTIPRQAFYLLTGQREKASKIVTEHFFWRD